MPPSAFLPDSAHFSHSQSRNSPSIGISVRLFMNMIVLYACSILIALFAFVPGAHANCGSSRPPTEARIAARNLQRAQQNEVYGRATDNISRQTDSLLITTYVHIVEEADKVGLITDTMLHDQMKVLNDTFAPHRIQFVVKDVTHTVNDTWATTTRHPDKARALRQGAYDELNLYFESGIVKAGLVTGICSFPVEDPQNTGINGTSWAIYDGCHVSPGTMPGGSGHPGFPTDVEGKTATHEVGHWFGLFHTFEGFSCDGEGDFIDDTPALITATQGCPEAADTCPDQPGLDPIHNYMDYSSHYCLWEFTPLQEERMYRSFHTLREGKAF